MAISSILKAISPLADIIEAGRGGGGSGKKQQSRSSDSDAPSYKRGGTKRGTGAAKLHRNEDILAPRKKKSRMRGRRGGR